MSEICINGVRKTYGEVTALKDVSLRVEEGTTFGLLGTNGAGKTTLFRLLIGHDTPDAGTLTVADLSPEEGADVRQRVGYLPENAGFPSSFTGREVLSFHADVRGVPKTSRAGRIEEALGTVGLSEASGRVVGGYSKGMNRRLGLATVLVAEPRVLLLDEPTSGLDPMGMDAFHEVVERLARETSITIVFSTHTLTEVERLCDQVAILDGGRVRASGQIEELRRRVDETVTLELWGSGERGLSDVASRLRNESGVRTVDRAGTGRLRVRCGRAEIYNVLSAVRGLASVEGFEVREPGMGEVFRRAVQPAPEGEMEPALEATNRPLQVDDTNDEF